jgi:hypothetical protein
VDRVVKPVLRIDLTAVLGPLVNSHRPPSTAPARASESPLRPVLNQIRATNTVATQPKIVLTRTVGFFGRPTNTRVTNARARQLYADRIGTALALREYQNCRTRLTVPSPIPSRRAICR